ncbi:MAG: exonuclease SbcCD subunit D [Planctomycetia bacterium]|nr:exonuclease SbcCD subunit D [Planctomycetia bacterium]
MKFLHLSDLHLGKRIKEYSMIEDQKYILDQIIKIAETNRPDAVIIAGDIYDRSLPSEEAVNLFDSFLNDLTQYTDNVFILCGNHDSPERLAFGRKIFQKHKIHFSAVFNGPPEPITLEDQWGKVYVHMLPFIKPAIVRSFYNEIQIENCQQAMEAVIQSMNINTEERNILIAHQFLTDGITSESEIRFVGGTDNIDADLFSDFDYTALGHLHCPQSIKCDTIRYAGSPLKYSLSEVDHKKSVVLAELKEKGKADIQIIPLIPLHEMRKIRGPYSDLIKAECAEGEKRDDYVWIVLTDEDELPNALREFRSVYPNVMELKYDNCRTRSHSQTETLKDVEKISPLDAFEKLYVSQNNQEMTEEQKEFLLQLINTIWGEVQ